MNDATSHLITDQPIPIVKDGTLVLAFSGWMDGGDVSTGTVERLIDLLDASKFAEVDFEPFYIFNFPGSMELAAMFRPHIEIEDGTVGSVEMPTNRFYHASEQKLLLFVGKEPNLQWRTFSDCIFDLCRRAEIRRVVFVGSFGGAVPHTREPRLYTVCSEESLLPEMESYGLRRTGYSGPGSFMTYLMSRVPEVGVEMVSLVAEIPGYLQGTNPASIEAVTRRLAKLLQLHLDLDSLRSASTDWEMEVSDAIADNEELSEQVKSLEESYDDDLLEEDAGSMFGEA